MRTASLPPAVRSRRHVPEGCPLSVHEFRVLEMLADGLTYQQIARQRNLSPSTIRTHLHSIYMRLDVVDRAQAVIYAWKAGWVDPDGSKFKPEGPPARKREKITPTQARYLDACDRFIRSGSLEDAREMSCWADAIHYEQGLNPLTPPQAHELTPLRLVDDRGLEDAEAIVHSVRQADSTDPRVARALAALSAARRITKPGA